MRPLTTKNLIKFMYFQEGLGLQVDLINTQKEGKHETLETFQVTYKSEDEKYTTRTVELHMVAAYNPNKEPVLKTTNEHERFLDLETYERLVSYELQHIVIEKEENAKITTSGVNTFAYDIESSAGFPFMNDHFIQIKESDLQELDSAPRHDLPSAKDALKESTFLTAEHHPDFQKFNDFVYEYADLVDENALAEDKLEYLQNGLDELDQKAFVDGSGGLRLFSDLLDVVIKVRKDIKKLTEGQFTDTGEELRTRVIIGHDRTYRHKV